MQLKVYSESTRQYQQGDPQAEALYRAQHNDVIHHQGDNYADAIRASYPSVRIFSYQLYRLATPGVAAEWDAYCAANLLDPEQGYCHIAGVRRIHPPTGWYVMNMGNANYVSWQHENTRKVFKGIRYGSPQFTFPPALHAVMVDLTLWYSNYDDIANENILGTDEYAGTGELYRQHCRQAFESLVSFVASHAGELGVDRRVYPNFGNVLEAERADADTTALKSAAPNLICCENGCQWLNGEPTQRAESVEIRWATLASLLDGTREVMVDGFVNKSESQANRDRAKLGVAAWLLMAYEPGMLARFYYFPEDAPEHISAWEDNSILRAARGSLGEPLGPYTIIANNTKSKVYERLFDRGRITLSLRKTGQTGTQDNLVIFPAARAVSADGTLGSIVTSLNLSIGQGEILLYASGTSPRVMTYDDRARVLAPRPTRAFTRRG